MLRSLFIFTAILSLILLIQARLLPSRALHVDKGNLYEICRVDQFSRKLPISNGKFNKFVENAEIQIIGDSHLNLNFGHQLMGDQIREMTNLSVSTQVFMSRYFLNEVRHFHSPKIILLLSSECFLPMRFNKLSYTKAYKELLPYRRVFTQTEQNLRSRFRNSQLGNSLLNWISTFRYVYLGGLSSQTLQFPENGNRLYANWTWSSHSPGSYQYSYRDEEIRNYVEILGDFKKYFKSEHFLFMVVPNKITIEAKSKQVSYSNFIPRLHGELKKANIDYVDLYSVFMKHDQELYYAWDTHLNGEGVNLAAKSVSRKIQEILRAIKSPSPTGQTLH